MSINNTTIKLITLAHRQHMPANWQSHRPRLSLRVGRRLGRHRWLWGTGTPCAVLSPRRTAKVSSLIPQAPPSALHVAWLRNDHHAKRCYCIDGIHCRSPPKSTLYVNLMGLICAGIRLRREIHMVGVPKGCLAIGSLLVALGSLPVSAQQMRCAPEPFGQATVCTLPNGGTIRCAPEPFGGATVCTYPDGRRVRSSPEPLGPGTLHQDNRGNTGRSAPEPLGPGTIYRDNRGNQARCAPESLGPGTVCTYTDGRRVRCAPEPFGQGTVCRPM